MYSTAPADRALVGWILTLYRETVGIFYTPARLSPRWVNLTPLQRSSRYIIHPRPTEPSWGESYPSTGKQLVDCTAPHEWSLVGCVLTLCREAAGVFYLPTRLSLCWVSLTPLQGSSWCILQPPYSADWVVYIFCDSLLHSLVMWSAILLCSINFGFDIISSYRIISYWKMFSFFIQVSPS